jgi:dolichyl-phosphate-mannose--protein O-mannosyl transferase
MQRNNNLTHYIHKIELIRDRIKNGDTIRLVHLATNKNLHSHLHPSPLSNQQEVSAFAIDDKANGDTGNHFHTHTHTHTHIHTPTHPHTHTH